jgi:RNA polymerase sigma-70 factor (ECF subfamily)
MPTTSLSLLDRLRQSPQPDSWDRFVRLYAPLLLAWARQQHLQDADAEDVVQRVFLKLLRLLPAYQRAEGQGFRGWLFTLCRNECRDFHTRRATRTLPTSEGLSETPDRPTPDDSDEGEYRRRLVRRALELVRSDFSPSTWEAFTQFVLQGRPAAEVAASLGISTNAVYLARNRVLTRLRQELAGFLD